MKTRFITLPNAITLLNLICGTLGVVSMVSLQSPQALRIGFVLMLAAAVFDFLDGFAARLTRQYSALGAQLDSLADMVSFGVLPSIIAMKVYYIAGGCGWWSALMLLGVVCAALRLARFNVSDDQKTVFKGLPVPAFALLVGAAGWYAAGRAGLPAHGCASWVILVCVVALSLLMVSPVVMFSLKFDGFGLRRNAVRYVYLAMSLVIILFTGMEGIGLAIVLYILSSLIMWLAGAFKRV